MKSRKSNQRAKQFRILRKCPIPQKVLADLLEHLAALEDVQLEDLVKDVQQTPEIAGLVLEELAQRQTFEPFAMRLPWSGMPGSALRPCAASLECLCEYDPFPNVYYDRHPWGVAVLGSRAYLPARTAGLVVADISNPSEPVTLGRFRSEAASSNGIVAFTHRNRAYALLASLDLLEVVDVTNPAHMCRVWEKSNDKGRWDAALMGSFALVAAGESGVEVFDVTNPLAPSRIAELRVGGHAWGVATQGSYAYVANNEHLAVVDMSNPRSPRVISHGETTGAAMRVWLAGNYAYVSCGGLCLDVLDVSTPAQPVRLGACNLPGRHYGAAFAGEHVLLADIDAGLHVCKLNITSDNWEWADSDRSSSFYFPKPGTAHIKQCAANPPEPKPPTPGKTASSPVARPVACRIEFHGEKASLGLEPNRSRTEKQAFEVFVGAVKFEVRYELPRSRAKALRTLKRGTFNSHVMTCDRITDLPGKPGFVSCAHDWFREAPSSRSTWRELAEISDEEEKTERISVYEYFTLFKPGFWAVTLEMADGSEVSACSPDHPFSPQEFADGTGKPILTLLAMSRLRQSNQPAAVQVRTAQSSVKPSH